MIWREGNSKQINKKYLSSEGHKILRIKNMVEKYNKCKPFKPAENHRIQELRDEALYKIYAPTLG
jgi:hypothetical protein